MIYDEELHRVIEIESTTFGRALVDAAGEVYFDLSGASQGAQYALVSRAWPSERFLQVNGRTYYSGRLVRRHMPRKARPAFDIVVDLCREKAAEWSGEFAPKPGRVARVLRTMGL